jgi:hypothetical protein
VHPHARCSESGVWYVWTGASFLVVGSPIDLCQKFKAGVIF